MSAILPRHRFVVGAALLMLVAAMVGLTRLSRGRRATPAPASSSAATFVELPPLTSPSWLVDLDVSGGAGAVVAVPVGAREPRPVLIALHGGADRAEWACGTWTGISRSRAFVLCPRGKPLGNDRFGWGKRGEVETELRGALRALKARFGPHVASGPVVLAAFGAGAEHALEIARLEPTFFSRVALVAAGSGLGSAGSAAVYAKSGGKRVIFVVSDPQSRAAGNTYWLFARGAGLDTKVLDLGDLGRVLDARVAAGISPELPWLVAGDPLYAPGKSPEGDDPGKSPEDALRDDR